MKQLIVLVFTIFCTSLCKCVPLLVNNAVDFTHSTQLDNNGEVALEWSFNETYIVFQLSVETSGWIGMGVAPSASMAGADIAVMWEQSGEFVIKDLYSEQNGLPDEDESHDLVLLSGQTTNGRTVVQFGRKLIACDEKDNDISDDTLRIIYAYGNTKPNGESLTFADKHENSKRGNKHDVLCTWYLKKMPWPCSKSIRLLNRGTKEQPKDEGLSSMVLTNTDVVIPALHTYYHCKQHRIVLGNQKVHIVKIEPVVHPGNEAYVHHFAVYRCSGLTQTTGDYGHACFDGENSKHYTHCNRLMFAWAIGGEEFIYPEDIGYPLDDIDEPLHIMIEMHFDNPDIIKGTKDSSGIKIHYTPILRSIDAGVLEVGEPSDPSLFVPKGATEWRTIAECHGSCVTDSFAEGQTSIKIFAVMLHAHLLGRKLILHHYRNGMELQPISTENYYDFDYQEYNYIVEVEFKAGDSLVMECIYDNSQSSKPIFGGLGTSEEMCVAFLQYYPKIDTFACWSSPDRVGLGNIFGVSTNASAIFNPYFYYTDFLPKFHGAVTNSNEDWKSLNEKVLKNPYQEFCNVDFYKTPFKNRTLYLTKPYEKTEKECNSAHVLHTANFLLISLIAIVFSIYNL